MTAPWAALHACHAVAAGLWLGCVATELVFERALRGPDQMLRLARLHRRVDLWVELPVLLAVTLSGAGLLRTAAPGPVLWAKLTAGSLAVLANLACVAVVLRRCAHAEAGNRAGFAAADLWQHRLGAVVLAGLLTALGLGLLRA